jgi:hemolysin activation/secretion protein/AraC-like DNA-binding protein
VPKLENFQSGVVTVEPAAEWSLQPDGWAFVQLGLGTGYWFQGPQTLDLSERDALLFHPAAKGRFLASRVGQAQLRWFVIRPDSLPGLLTHDERTALSDAAKSSSPRHFRASHEVALRAAELFSDASLPNLVRRCRMLDLLMSGLAPDLELKAASDDLNDARARLRQWLAQFPESELLNYSVDDFAREMGCSVRHLSRLFTEEVGASFRSRQTELRLLKARQLLSNGNAKIIHVALESGYRHLGLFNALFKKRFGMTPTKWREQNKTSAEPRRRSGNTLRLAAAWLVVSGGLPLIGLAQSAPRATSPAQPPTSTNAPSAPATNGPALRTFEIRRYDVTGNTLLSSNILQATLEPYTSPKATRDTIRDALAALTLAYRGRGFASVGVTLPPQQITNGTVRIAVTEGKISDFRVVGNRWFSTENVLRALPGLRTNVVLNDKVLQADIDNANANSDRQIYPILEPGPEPGTSSLKLKVKDQLPLHGRFELNNQFTPGTPELRGSASVQYQNLWQREHAIGLQYGFALQEFKEGQVNKFDRPLIANYSGYYRIPLSTDPPVQEVIDANPQRFGYDEVAKKFRLPPTSGRTELNIYANRSTTDTGVKLTPVKTVNPPPIALYSFDSGQDLSTTEAIGFRISKPLPQFWGIRSTASVGADLKNYQKASYNTNNFSEVFTYLDDNGNPVQNVIPFSNPQPRREGHVSYLPFALRWDGSRADALGFNSVGLGVNANFIGGPFSVRPNFVSVSNSKIADGNYVTAQFSAAREQKLSGDWTLALRADGQWANQPLISSEQFGIGGTGGVRGYMEGERYGDRGWRVTLEPRTPTIDVGLVDGTMPMRARAVVFADYGQSYLIDPSFPGQSETMLGAGWGVTANIGSTFDLRATMAWAVRDTVNSLAGHYRFYFAVGAQF